MKLIRKFIFILCIFIFLSCSSEKDILKISFFDVKQGDSSFINYKNASILVDTGEAIFTDNVIKSIKSQGISKIDYVILTHDHSDHASGFLKIYENFEVKNLILPDTLRNETFNDIENFLQDSSTTIHYIKNPKVLKIFDNFKIKFLSSFDSHPREFNDSSLVFKLSVNELDVLYTGDIEEDGQLRILDKDITSEILKVPHHGAYNNDKNNVRNFLEKVRPNISIISVGNNSYGHPNNNTLNILKDLNSKILRTDMHGTVNIICDFKNDSLVIENSF